MGKEVAIQSVFLKLTSGLVIDGRIVPAGSLVEVTEQEAREYLYRGKAELAIEADFTVTGDGSGVALDPVAETQPEPAAEPAPEAAPAPRAAPAKSGKK